MFKPKIAAGLMAAGALVAAGAGPAFASGPVIVEGNATPASQTAVVGQSVSVSFGTYEPYTPGNTVQWWTDYRTNSTAICDFTSEDCTSGPNGTVTASASGVASVTFTPTAVGTYTVWASQISSGENVGALAVGDESYASVTVAAAPNGGGGGGSPSGGSASGGSTSTGGSSSTGAFSSSLPKTGGSINPAVVGGLSGGLLLAGAGTVMFANRRRETTSK